MKKLLMLTVFLLLLLSVGCNETIVLEEDMMINKEINGFEVAETPIDLDVEYSVFKFVNGKVGVGRSTYNSDELFEYISDFIDEDGNIIDSNNNLLFHSEYGSRTIYNVEGITQEYDTENEENIVFEISNECSEISGEIKDKLLEPFIKYN